MTLAYCPDGWCDCQSDAPLGKDFLYYIVILSLANWGLNKIAETFNNQFSFMKVIENEIQQKFVLEDPNNNWLVKILHVIRIVPISQ